VNLSGQIANAIKIQSVLQDALLVARASDALHPEAGTRSGGRQLCDRLLFEHAPNRFKAFLRQGNMPRWARERSLTAFGH